MKKQKYIYYGVLLLLLVACTSTAVISLVSEQKNNNSPQTIPTPSNQEYNYSIPTEPVGNNVKQSSTDLGKKAEKNKNSKQTKAKSTPKVTSAPISFSAPIMGKVSLEFSNDKPVFSKTLQEWRTHSGVDIQGDIGAAVLAAKDGTVESVKADPRYGVTVIIEHADDYKSVYSNLSKDVSVVPGQKVKTGDVVGAIGDTAAFESLEATHVHFEILKKNICVNPCDYISTLK